MRFVLLAIAAACFLPALSRADAVEKYQFFKGKQYVDCRGQEHDVKVILTFTDEVIFGMAPAGADQSKWDETPWQQIKKDKWSSRQNFFFDLTDDTLGNVQKHRNSAALLIMPKSAVFKDVDHGKKWPESVNFQAKLEFRDYDDDYGKSDYVKKEKGPRRNPYVIQSQDVLTCTSYIW